MHNLELWHEYTAITHTDGFLHKSLVHFLEIILAPLIPLQVLIIFIIRRSLCLPGACRVLEVENNKSTLSPCSLLLKIWMR